MNYWTGYHIGSSGTCFWKSSCTTEVGSWVGIQCVLA